MWLHVFLFQWVLPRTESVGCPLNITQHRGLCDWALHPQLGWMTIAYPSFSLASSMEAGRPGQFSWGRLSMGSGFGASLLPVSMLGKMQQVQVNKGHSPRTKGGSSFHGNQRQRQTGLKLSWQRGGWVQQPAGKVASYPWGYWHCGLWFLSHSCLNYHPLF